MGKMKYIVSFCAVGLCALLPMVHADAKEVKVSDGISLQDAIATAENGDVITLEQSITLDGKVELTSGVEITIDGANHTITGNRAATGSVTDNITLITASLNGSKIKLKNVTLKDSPKYGVQAYDGATVILDNVSITGFRYGGVLANGGNVEVIDLHLGYNGTGANNGIEIAKGAAATNNPTLTMNGTLKSDSTENVVKIAENDSLTEFTVTNTPNTTNKIVLTEDKVVLTDKYNNVIAETAVPDKVTGNADEQKVIVTVMAKDKEIRFTANEGTMITADLVKSHIVLEDNEQIDGYYTDANYTTEFNFNNPLNADTTIYAKISTVETTVPETKPETEEKDETPKTGVENYLGLAVLVIVLSSTVMISMKKKNREG